MAGYQQWLPSDFTHDDVIRWNHFPRYWPFVRGIHRSPGNSPHKGQWRGALMFSLISVWINGCVSNRESCDLRRYHAHYDVIVMSYYHTSSGLHTTNSAINELLVLEFPGWVPPRAARSRRSDNHRCSYTFSCNVYVVSQTDKLYDALNIFLRWRKGQHMQAA